MCTDDTCKTFDLSEIRQRAVTSLVYFINKRFNKYSTSLIKKAISEVFQPSVDAGIVSDFATTVRPTKHGWVELYPDLKERVLAFIAVKILHLPVALKYPSVLKKIFPYKTLEKYNIGNYDSSLAVPYYTIEADVLVKMRQSINYIPFKAVVTKTGVEFK